MKPQIPWLRVFVEGVAMVALACWRDRRSSDLDFKIEGKLPGPNLYVS